MDWIQLAQDRVRGAESREYGHETSGFINGGKILKHLNNSCLEV
jgi:hypothetical protein